MPRVINVNREMFVALCLGLLALAGNLFALNFCGSGPYIPIGNLFLFLSALTLGVPGALVSYSAGGVFENLLLGSQVELFRLLVAVVTISYFAKKLPRVPGFAVALVLWLTLFIPGLFYLSAVSGDATLLPFDKIFFQALSEVALVMIAGVMLLNSRIWTLITHSPRRLQITSLLIHLITCISSVAMFGGISALIGSSTFKTASQLDSSGLIGVMSVMLLGITVPALLAWRMAIVLSKNFQELFSAGLLTGNNRSFSGLSSEFWRRKSSPDIKKIDLRIADTTTSNSDLPAQVAAAIGTAEQKLPVVTPDQGLCALNRNGTITFMNRKFRRFCEITSNEVLGKILSSLSMNQVICKRIMQLVEESFSKGPRSCEIKINQLPEKLRFYEVASHRSDAFDDSSIINGPDSIIITIKDITERRTVEAHLLQSQKLESLGTLVEGIAHTFNNSLTTIAGQASFAKRCQERAQVDKSLNEILKSAFGAGAVVRQLLDFASGRPSLMRAENMVHVVNERLDLLKRLAGDNYEVTYEKSVDKIGAVCDTNLIMQALTNLVLNAKEASASQSGRIVISIDQETVDEAVSQLHPGTRIGEFVRLRVKDFGQGMSKDVLAKAFDPLFTTKASTGHTGLGLSIVFAIVRAHDGFLTAESQLDKGTTISIYLPIAELDESSERPRKDTGRGSLDAMNPDKMLQGNKERILVVEDEENVRDLVTAMLSNLGYNVTCCADGQEAFDKAKAEEFDLILVDMVIPKIKGLDLIEKVKEHGSKAKSLLMTGYGSSIQITNPQTKIIHKPFDIETLAKAVKTTLKH